MEKAQVSIFWFRRDLRLQDNHGLSLALNGKYPVLPLFIFDTEILASLKRNDARVSFIHQALNTINTELQQFGSSLYCPIGKPIAIWETLLSSYDIQAVYTNEDYEPYALKRDQAIRDILDQRSIDFYAVKDQVIFAKDEIVKNDNTPYTVYTPYKNKWMSRFIHEEIKVYDTTSKHYFVQDLELPSLEDIGFKSSNITVAPFRLDILDHYDEHRNFPALDSTSHLSVYLRFGTVSIRQIVRQIYMHQSFLNELIWREFFMQILYHFPHVAQTNFRSKYDGIAWCNNEADFERWKAGNTGYPMVDAGMRELNATGYMHNRVRMVTAGFLCKHLLIDWRWGEAYFAEQLLDYELSANNGNWQWAAGTGCDAAPYFRVFNPSEQIKKFDKNLEYIRRWIPELDTTDYPEPMIDHKMARQRAIDTYKQGIQNL